MPTLETQRCDRCGLAHHDGPLFLCLKCTAVLCRNQLAVRINIDDEVWHKLTDGKRCGPVVEHHEQQPMQMEVISKAEDGPSFSTVTVWRVAEDGKRTAVYSMTVPSDDAYTEVDMHLTCDAPGLAGGGTAFALIPKLVITKGQKLEVEFGGFPSKKEQEECRADE